MYAIIDLETTGGRPEFDRIMEIAIYLHDGNRITGEYSSLVNPGVPIPPFVARLTGISQEMVSTAPAFQDICQEVREVLGDRVFVAHNAPFDHGFLSYQFRMEGIEITNKVLCTCATSRKVLPGHASYSLGKLCRSVGITLENAHRAAADALATTRLLEMLLDRSGHNLLPFMRDPSKPNPHCQIPDIQLNTLSEKAGILFFKDALGNVIFLAKAWNIRKKAKALTSKFGTGKMTGLGIQAVAAEAEVTGSRIAASVREHELLQELRPVFNRKFRDGDSRLAIYDEPDEEGYIRISLRPLDNNQQPIAIFSSRTAAHKHLKTAIKEYKLYPEFCGLANEPLVPVEPPQAYNERAEEALAYFKQQRRSYVITDRGPDPDTKWVFIVEDSRFAGYRLLQDTVALTIPAMAEEFRKADADSAAIIRTMSRHIAKREYLSIEPLQESA